MGLGGEEGPALREGKSGFARKRVKAGTFCRVHSNGGVSLEVEGFGIFHS